jgi:hypothetical protein
MITDIFTKRYKRILFSRPYESHYQFFGCVWHLICEICFYDPDLSSSAPENKNAERIFATLNRSLAAELSQQTLIDIGNSHISSKRVCEYFFLLKFDRNAHHSLAIGYDAYVKNRLSFLELAIKQFEKSNNPTRLNSLAREINDRFKEFGLAVHYHSGIIQLQDDAIVETQISEPFWPLLRDSKWKNVDDEMKMAIHERDNGIKNVHTNAFNALESTMNVIEHAKQWKVQVNLAGHLNLMKKQNVIDEWEYMQLDILRDKIRNPSSHGAGAGSQIVLTDCQTNVLIEQCMIWIKTLILRT